MKVQFLTFMQKVAKVFLLIAAVVLTCGSIYHIIFSYRIIPGVQIGAIPVGGMTYSQAKQVLLDAQSKLQPKLTFKDYTKTFDINWTGESGIDLAYDFDGSLARAFEIGRTKNLIIDTKEKISGLFRTLYIKHQYKYDENKLNLAILNISGEINDKADNAYFVLANGKLTILPEVNGFKTNTETLYKSIKSSLDNMEFPIKQIPTEKQTPVITEVDLNTLKPVTEKILSKPFKVTYQKKEWKVTPEQLLDLLAVQKANGKTTLTISKIKFEAFVTGFEPSVNTLPKALVTSLDGDTVKEFEIKTGGIEIDYKQFTKDLEYALLNSKDSVAIATTETTGLKDKSAYGITKLLAAGKSKYTGSGSNRIHNLALAAERANGILVAPNDIFSFNKTVGEISVKTGYDVGYIIQNGRTILGEGGGVCQTSTTLFRAVLNAGLPVVQRFAHAYRVHYYEIESALGFDASVYQPSLDFQFRNDTSNYILVESSINKAENSLEFRIYGTPDGRIVDITTPIVTNLIPAPEALYQDDPTLPKGTVKQIDFAAGGATAYFTRTVTKDGKELFKDTYTSKYQPWRAIFLKGTKD